ncbi:sugar phosphate isomerase/epimerase family protein [Oceanobacillus timonensis]|uniref:sugar phosphate isomerase/epimerase family protein n=1 Tax=Oceanobacillus timonensis TaxID=1926285 RepID=UPI0009B9AD25|nr:sugar phosphate isomerase/epimerase family protein [Oceanobacillus timonensis]
MSIKFGCHTSTWVLDYDKEVDVIDHIIDVVSNSGFKGLDIQAPLLGKYKDNPELFKEKLESKGVELAAITVPFNWDGDEESIEEKEKADFYIDFLKNFPGAIMNLPSRVGPNRDNLLVRQKQIIKSANAVGKRAFNNGVIASFHPASPQTSYFRTADDYKVLFEGLDTDYIGYTPDCGHIKAGGMEPFDIVKDNLSIIRHVHFKDCSNKYEWKKMGTGDIDYPAIVQFLYNNGYNGWIMVEEETEETKTNPDGCIHNIYKYFEENVIPIVKGVKQS